MRDCTTPIIVGKVGRHYGTKGWVKVYSYTRPIENILCYARWLLMKCENSTSGMLVHVTSVKQQAKNLLAKLEGVEDRETAQQLTGKWIAIEQSQLDPPLPGEYYWEDLVGLSVINHEGTGLGVVDHLIETGANDVLVVRQTNGTEADERLIPWSPKTIANVNIDGGYIRVNWYLENE